MQISVERGLPTFAHCLGKKCAKNKNMYYPEFRQSCFLQNSSKVLLSALLYKFCKSEFQMQSAVISILKVHKQFFLLYFLKFVYMKLHSICMY